MIGKEFRLQLKHSKVETRLLYEGITLGMTFKIHLLHKGHTLTLSVTRQVIFRSSRASLPDARPSFPRWIQYSFFLRSVRLFQHLYSLIREATVPRNGIVEDHLLQITTPLLPLIGIITPKWCAWFPPIAIVPLDQFWVWVLDTR